MFTFMNNDDRVVTGLGLVQELSTFASDIDGTTIVTTDSFYTKVGANWVLQQTLVPGDTASGDIVFNSNGKISGDTAIFGSHQTDDTVTDSGSSFIFTRTGSVWTEQQKLVASDPVAGDEFGYSVDVSVDSCAIVSENDYLNTGESYVYIFTRTGSVWTEQQKLTILDTTGLGGFGRTVVIDGDTLMVNGLQPNIVSPPDPRVYIFKRNTGVWAIEQEFTKPSGIDGNFGEGMAIDGDTCVIGSPANDGSVYIYTRTGSVWTEQQKIIANDPEPNPGIFAGFGQVVDISGDTCIVGANYTTDAGVSARGKAYIFTRTTGVWTQVQTLEFDGSINYDYIKGVLIDGNNIAVTTTNLLSQISDCYLPELVETTY